MRLTTAAAAHTLTRSQPTAAAVVGAVGSPAVESRHPWASIFCHTPTTPTLQSLLFWISLLFPFPIFLAFFLAFLLFFQRFEGFPQREKPLLFSEFPLFFFSKKSKGWRVRAGTFRKNSRKSPERPRKRSQSVSWNSPQEYGWDPPSPIIQGTEIFQIPCKNYGA